MFQKLPTSRNTSAAVLAARKKAVRRNTLRGFCDLRLRELKMVLHDVAVHQHDNGSRWVGLPSKPIIDRDGVAKRNDAGKIEYVPLLELEGRETRDAFSNAAVKGAARIQSARAQYGGGGAMNADSALEDSERWRRFVPLDYWKSMNAATRAGVLSITARRNETTSFNKQKGDDVEWAQVVVNPVNRPPARLPLLLRARHREQPAYGEGLSTRVRADAASDPAACPTQHDRPEERGDRHAI